LPSDAEWTTLTDYVGSDAGTKLKSKYYNGTDDYGFNAIPILRAGGTSPDGWWSSTAYYLGACPDLRQPSVCEPGIPAAVVRQVLPQNSDVLRFISRFDKTNAVRCVKELIYP